jgi:ubiquinone/menaquinone biosynthesis C-methylase UbiE
MRDPYARLAPFYDGMARDPDIRGFYRRWHDSLRALLIERGVRGGVIVDIACGTGNSTIPWARRRGWRVIGVDRSAAMLRVARGKSRTVRWVKQELTRLSLDVRADAVTCHFDALNHVLDERDLQRVFARVARLLRPGGLFQFDLNTVHMLRWLHLREKLFHVPPHWFVASNEYDEERAVATFTQHWFVRSPPGVAAGRGVRRAGHPPTFERIKVTVQERAFTDSSIATMLERSGLRMVRAETQVEIDRRPMRILYVAEKPAARAAR